MQEKWVQEESRQSLVIIISSSRFLVYAQRWEGKSKHSACVWPAGMRRGQGRGRASSRLLDQSVHSVLGTVVVGADLKDKRQAEQRLLVLSVRHHLVAEQTNIHTCTTMTTVRTTTCKTPTTVKFLVGIFLSSCKTMKLIVSLTCKMVKFSRTLFIMYFSGRCLRRWMKLTM